MRTRILLVEDHQLLRDGIKHLIKDEPGLEVVGETGEPVEALKLVNSLMPDLVLMDIELKGGNGIELSRKMISATPGLKIAILSAHTDPTFIRTALQCGIVGYLSKVNAHSELIKAVNAIMAGQVYLCSEAATFMTQEYRSLSGNGTSDTTLSERQRLILKLISEGQSTKEIAATLTISVKTIEAQRARIMDKTGVRSIAELTKYAIRQGLTSL